MPDSAQEHNLRNLFEAWPEKAIAHLYDKYYDKMLRIATWRTRDPKAAEDIVQEALIELWENRERINKIRNLRLLPYLYTIVKNKSTAVFNKALKLNENQMRYINDRLHTTNPGVDDDIISREEKEIIFKIIATFTVREQQCLMMKFYHGMSNESIAMNMNVTVKAVEKNITSAYKRFRKHRSSIS